MQFRITLSAAFFAVVAAVAAGQASAEEYYDAGWVASNGQQCNVACRDSGGRLPVDATGANGTTVNVCRVRLGEWASIGYNQRSACLTLKGDRLSPGVVEKDYECLCGRL